MSAIEDRACPDCRVALGQPHLDFCDVARCLQTGLQRIGCAEAHECGRDRWEGRWPGEADCERLGWMLAPGLPDLNRLVVEARWDAARLQWEAP
jgi:hypothetical protein